MPLPGLGSISHARSHSNTNTPEAPSTLIQAAQTFAGIGVPTASAVQRQHQHQLHQAEAGLRVQTSHPNLLSSSPASGIAPIQSGSSASGAFSGLSSVAVAVADGSFNPLHAQPPKKNLSFQIPSPTKASHGERYSSPPELLHQQRPVDPTQLQQLSLQQPIQQQYQAYHQSQPTSNTGSRPSAQSIVTAPGAVPQLPQQGSHQAMHRTNTTGSQGRSKYSPNSVASGPGESRKYTHPGALTPTYPSSSQHGSSHSHSSGAHLGMGLSGLPGASSGREREDVVGGIGAVSSGKWMSPFGCYAVDWCKWPVSTGGGYGRIAIGSYAEDSHNYIQILDTRPSPSNSNHSETPPTGPSLEFSKLAEASHTFPITRILWEPTTTTKPVTDLLATSGDHLRLWSLPNTVSGGSSASATPAGNSITRSSNFHGQPTQKLTPLALLSNSKSSDFTAPLTSLDWNPISPSLIITSSIDTTCTIWDIPTLTAKTQLIAHDKEVFDVRFMSGSVDVFASCGADGSVRMFDLRSLEHSTIIYEPGVKAVAGEAGSKEDGGSPVGGSAAGGGSPPPLLRLAASPHDSHLIATFSSESNIIRILDVRQPGQALIELKGHTNNVNCVEWNPARRGIVAGGGDDCLVLIWDLINNTSSTTTTSSSSAPAVSASNGGASSSATSNTIQQERTPVAAWRCDYEVNNISWSPANGGNAGNPGGEWLGVVGGRGLWGVKV